MDHNRPGEAVKAIVAMAKLVGLLPPRKVAPAPVAPLQPKLGPRELARRIIFLLEEGQRER